jgi:hypothetical protein
MVVSGNLSWVRCAVSYDPKILDTIGSLQQQTAGEPNTPTRKRPHLSRLKRWGHQPKKKLISVSIRVITSPQYDLRG